MGKLFARWKTFLAQEKEKTKDMTPKKKLEYFFSYYKVEAFIVLVVLSLFDRVIGRRSDVYRYAIDFTLVFSVIEGLHAAGIDIPGLNALMNQYVPFYSVMLGWLLPACLGAILGWLVAISRRKEKQTTIDQIR